jgi:hypothetical protein
VNDCNDSSAVGGSEAASVSTLLDGHSDGANPRTSGSQIGQGLPGQQGELI